MYLYRVHKFLFFIRFYNVNSSTVITGVCYQTPLICYSQYSPFNCAAVLNTPKLGETASVVSSSTDIFNYS